MSNRFRVFKDVDGSISEPNEISFEHKIGDIVNVGSFGNQYKCTEIVSNDVSTTYIFKEPKKVYTYDW